MAFGIGKQRDAMLHTTKKSAFSVGDTLTSTRTGRANMGP